MVSVPYSKSQLDLLQDALDGKVLIPGVSIQRNPDGSGVALCEDDDTEVHVKMICGAVDADLAP